VEIFYLRRTQMSVRIRLQRIGRPKRAYYRVVAIDQRAKRNGKPIEILGQYDPVLQDNKLSVKQDRVEYWLKNGAKPSDTVASLLNAKKEVKEEVKKEEVKN
jgi:small subunit ribosomal protein S16